MASTAVYTAGSLTHRAPSIYRGIHRQLKDIMEANSYLDIDEELLSLIDEAISRAGECVDSADEEESDCLESSLPGPISLEGRPVDWDDSFECEACAAV